MNATIKISIIAIVTLLLQSCNMAKHYGNMRINHPKENNESQPQENTIRVETIQSPASSKSATDNDVISTPQLSTDPTDKAADSTIIQSIELIELIESIAQTENRKTSVNKENTRVKTAFKSKKQVKKSLKKHVKLRASGSAAKELSVDEWGYIAIGFTVIAFIILIIVTGSFLTAFLIAAQVFLGLISLIAIGIVLYAFWAVMNFLTGGY
jgi:uncharacterized membrane protein YdfJ with MMPL/SSD domain